ncbi:unnamed protein product [Macrosiphum euphorbiae]|uniref:Uncharacterized protein n=1 Tax=Macrosiphum euphorbiae TaxID=13131 RepID=A0AAV0XZW4_9HEMI|nr:unnamed protein product [Macrosiphum euphorbiae]
MGFINWDAMMEY